MQVRVVLAVGRAHGRDLLAAADPLTPAHHHFLEMAVERIDIFHVAALAIRVPHDDDVSPTQVNVTGEDDDSVADAVNRISQISVAAADAVPVFTDVAAS